jgi:hypothetical protein
MQEDGNRKRGLVSCQIYFVNNYLSHRAFASWRRDATIDANTLFLDSARNDCLRQYYLDMTLVRVRLKSGIGINHVKIVVPGLSYVSVMSFVFQQHCFRSAEFADDLVVRGIQLL